VVWLNCRAVASFSYLVAEIERIEAMSGLLTASRGLCLLRLCPENETYVRSNSMKSSRAELARTLFQ